MTSGGRLSQIYLATNKEWHLSIRCVKQGKNDGHGHIKKGNTTILCRGRTRTNFQTACELYVLHIGRFQKIKLAAASIDLQGISRESPKQENNLFMVHTRCTTLWSKQSGFPTYIPKITYITFNRRQLHVQNCKCVSFATTYDGAGAGDGGDICIYPIGTFKIYMPHL